MKRAAIGLAALSVFFGQVHQATAAGTARVDVFPDQPRVGELVTVQVRTFVLLDVAAPTPWAAPADFPLVVGASKGVRDLVARLARDPADPYLWSGTLRFTSRGLWTLCAFDLHRRSLTSACTSYALAHTEVHVRRKRARVDVWHRLKRPFRIPSIAGGSSCPTSSRNPEGDLTRIGHAGLAWGRGPAYPGGLDPGEGKPVLRYANPIPPDSLFAGSAWFGNKVLWIIDPVYSGPVLIRGRQLDGPNELRFDRGLLPPREIRIPASRVKRDRPSFTRVRAPGCYGYQIDGLGFSYTIVFEARPF